MEIKADVISIEKLKDYFFVVPDYQREYVWTGDVHVARFLQDISDEFSPTARKQSNYFIGSTIVVKREDGAYDVVDGQQRLTTIVISICAIRDVLKNMADLDEELETVKEELRKVVKELLYKYDIATKKHTPRLALQYEESKDYLVKLISEKPFTDKATPSIKKMMEAYTTVHDYLIEQKNTDPEILLNFVSYFLANVEMVLIRPDDLGSALKIFETINERGVGLNAMDLLKNLLFSHAKADEFEVIKNTWREMLKNLDESKEGDKPLRFLRYFLIARYHSRVIREDEIYKWMISPEGKEKIKYQANPIAFAKELKAAAATYAKFIKATNSWDADPEYPSITGIGYLSKKTSRQHLVLLMALPDNIQADVTRLLAKNIESLVFYYAINRTLTKSYEALFANWANKIRMVRTMDDLKIFLNAEFNKELFEQQEKFDGQFANKAQGDLNPQYRIKYILGKAEEYIRQKVNFPTANFNFYQSQQLEHILPQTGINVPATDYPQPYDYSNAVYKLGNLTLLEAPINQSLNYSNDISSNEWFDVKRAAYLNSNILLTRTFSEIQIGEQTKFNGFATETLRSFGNWNAVTISARQEILKRLIKDIWKLYA
ncbi:DUF262 domain-containing HNH endonuclease family protein [Mucilaginibacter sp. UR6-1]|uniref:DUF262 domain-containing protein n=1 Tax=Mucilaginibacter sp. UR6-1 TaxID=1435643 RepID=UPI001E32799A|nr:DUF262 domain-containing protein [Mucilaginibacter sp. UR6-1]MCC8408605.1 DUF262 domain-containing HNH endonuclease family protein [Mucilaginibacter sp. UR6-1]